MPITLESIVLRDTTLENASASYPIRQRCVSDTVRGSDEGGIHDLPGDSSIIRGFRVWPLFCIGSCSGGKSLLDIDDRIMTVGELATYLLVAPETVRKMAKRGELPAWAVTVHWQARYDKHPRSTRKEWRFSKKQLDAWISERSLGQGSLVQFKLCAKS